MVFGRDKRLERISEEAEAKRRGELKADIALTKLEAKKKAKEITKAEAKEKRGWALSEGFKRSIWVVLKWLAVGVGIALLIFFLISAAIAGTLQIWGAEAKASISPLWGSIWSGFREYIDPSTYDPSAPQIKEVKEKNIVFGRLYSTKKQWSQNEVIQVRGRVKVLALDDGDDDIESDLEVKFSCEMEDYKGKVEVSIDGEIEDTRIVDEGETREYDIECKFLEKIGLADEKEKTAKIVFLKASLNDAITVVRLRVYHLIEYKLDELRKAHEDPLEGVDEKLIHEGRFIISECLQGCNVPVELKLLTNAQPLHEDTVTVPTDYSLDIYLRHKKSEWEGQLKEIKLLRLMHTGRLIPSETDCALGADFELNEGDKFLDTINERLEILRTEKDEDVIKRVKEYLDPDEIFMQCKFKVDAGEDYPAKWEEFKAELHYDYEIKSGAETVVVVKAVKGEATV